MPFSASSISHQTCHSHVAARHAIRHTEAGDGVFEKLVVHRASRDDAASAVVAVVVDARGRLKPPSPPLPSSSAARRKSFRPVISCPSRDKLKKLLRNGTQFSPRAHARAVARRFRDDNPIRRVAGRGAPRRKSNSSVFLLPLHSAFPSPLLSLSFCFFFSVRHSLDRRPTNPRNFALRQFRRACHCRVFVINTDNQLLNA